MTLKELDEYIPHCIICGKNMFIKISGLATKPSHIVPGYKYPTGATNILYTAKTSVHLKSFMKDGILHFKNKHYSLSIDPDTNKIISGIDLLNDLTTNWIHVHKNCQTCDFNIVCLHTDINKKFENFPPLKLSAEKLHYTMKRGKSVSITKNFYDDAALLGSRTLISVSGKPIKEINLDLTRFKNLEQLNNRLSTIIVFQ